MAGEERLADLLTTLGIGTETVSHAPVFTVEEAKSLRGAITGGHTKNLFVADKRGRFWLIVALEETKIDLKRAAKLLGAAQRLSFAAPAHLERLLGVTPGSVTPFGAIHDTAGEVTIVLEAAMMAVDPLNFHPLRNDRTTTIATADLVRFLQSTGHEPLVLDLAADQRIES